MSVRLFARRRSIRGLVLGTLLLIPRLGLAEEASNFSESERTHWAFRPVTHAPVPSIAPAAGSPPQNEVDSFILAELQKGGQNLSPVADKRTLLRRVTFDLIGLPPTPDEAAEFLADTSPDAYLRVVDRLLASPHYGEAWGRMWLDAVRFAETAGFNADPARPLAYKYRDYVIRAFNSDLPYNRFLREQLAGDELYPEDPQALVATGYCRMWADESNASNIHLARQLALNDLTSNLGAVYLGLSIGCAQCHDHKFDPILQTDFYQLQAFFSGIVLEDNLPVGSHAQLAEYFQQRQQWLDETADLRHELHAIEREARIKMAGDRRMKFPSDVLAAIDCLPEERNAMQRQLAFWSERQMEYKNDELPKHLSDEARARREELLKLLAEARKNQPKPPLEVPLMAVGELSSQPPKTHLLDTGSYDKPLQELSPHFPVVLRTRATHNPPSFTAPSERSSGRRSELARWLTSPENPLTDRVWVNRIWQGHFGRGLVENANDFGMQTPKPSHLELLDWLTSEFAPKKMSMSCCEDIAQSGPAFAFSTKRLHRLLVLSSTYQQQGQRVSSVDSPRRTYSFFPRRRLSSERIRDAWLLASGSLNDTMYGPGVRPELPPNFGGAGGWKVSEPADRTRRSVYIYAKRNLPYPMMAAFDFPDMHESCGCRTTTTIAPQALTLLNNNLIVNAARQLAVRSKHEANSADLAARVAAAWQIAYGRAPHPDESAAALKFVAEQQQVIADSDTSRTGEDASKVKDSDVEDTFNDLCHALLNANEFLFVE